MARRFFLHLAIALAGLLGGCEWHPERDCPPGQVNRGNNECADDTSLYRMPPPPVQPGDAGTDGASSDGDASKADDASAEPDGSPDGSR